MAGRRVAAAPRSAPVDDDALGDTGGFVERFRDRLAFDQILEGDGALDLGQNRPRVRIPFGDALAALDHVAFVDPHPRAVLNAMGRTLGAVGIGHRDHHVAHHGDQMTLAVLGDGLVLDRHLAVEIRLDERLLVDLRRAADVEGAHRQLGAGLADRLRRDHADRLAVVDRSAAGQIAAVALAADAVDQFAGQGRTDLHFLDAGLLDGVDMLLLHQRAALDHDLVGHRIAQVLAVGTAENPRGQRGDHGAGVDDGAHLDAELGAAIVGGDDAVLRHVDQTPRQVARVRGLQRGIRQPLAGAVGRVEVFEHRQTFLEVGNDRRLDDLARRLGHQAAHAGELAHLVLRTTRAGVRHHEDRVDLRLAALRIFPRGGDLSHHVF